jgi:hypothetical protein
MSALGTEFKYGIKMTPIDGIHLEDCDFEVTTYVYSNRQVTYKKGDAKHVQRIDEDSYKIIVYAEDAMKIGRGYVMAKITIHIPDNDYEDGFRTEVYNNLCTGETIT